MTGDWARFIQVLWSLNGGEISKVSLNEIFYLSQVLVIIMNSILNRSEVIRDEIVNNIVNGSQVSVIILNDFLEVN